MLLLSLDELIRSVFEWMIDEVRLVHGGLAL